MGPSDPNDRMLQSTGLPLKAPLSVCTKFTLRFFYVEGLTPERVTMYEMPGT